MKAQLTIIEGKQKGRSIALSEGTFLIGRGERCHLRPVSELVSREHAEFTLTETGLSVRDMGSRNGTLLNGKAVVTKKPLADGDRVQVGPLVFAVSLQPGTAEAPSAPAPPKRGGKSSKEPETVEAEVSPPVAHGDSTIMIPAFKTLPEPAPAGTKKKSAKGAKAAKPSAPTGSTASNEILRKMMEHRPKPKK